MTKPAKDLIELQGVVVADAPPPPGHRLPLLSDVLGSAAHTLPLSVAVRETLGITRTAWPIEIPLALPAGLLRDGFTLEICVGGQPRPSQVEIFTRWPDGSAQHLMLYACVDLAAHGSVELQITRPAPAGAPFRCDATDGQLRIDTGAATFIVATRDGKQIISAKVGGKEFVALDGQVACWAGFVADASIGGYWNDPTSAMEDLGGRVIESGPARCVVERTIRFASANQDELITRLYFYRDQPWVRLYSWYERTNPTHHPLVSRERAFAADLRYDGPVVRIAESRFGAISENEVVSIATPDGPVTVVLPWLRELGMEAAANVLVEADNGRAHVEWRPIDSPDLAQSPMNGPCWVPRYWREAALITGDGASPQAVRRTLELRDIEVAVDPAYQPHQALLDRLTLLGEHRDEFMQVAEAGDHYYLSENYPNDGIDGREWHNWESAYFHGFAWRQILLDAPVAAYPRTMKPDVLELMLSAYALSGETRFLRRAKLQARAWPTNVAYSGVDGMAYTMDDMGLHNLQPRGKYNPATTCIVPGMSNIGYPGKLLLAMFRMWVLTGEPRLKFAFDLLYRRVMQATLDKWPYRPFDGDRNWAVLRDLARLYQFTEDPRYLADLERLFKLLPEHIKPEEWYSNFHVRFWNNEGLALIYRLTGNEKAKRLHESLVKDYIDEARRDAATPRLIMGMTRSIPKALENGGLAYQIGVAVGQWAQWDTSGEAIKLIKHFVNVGTHHVLSPSRVWPGLHFRYYPLDVLKTEAWRDRCREAERNGQPPPRTDEAGAGQVPGEYTRTLGLLAKTVVPWSYDASERMITLWVTPAVWVAVSEKPLSIDWPGGRIECTSQDGVLHISMVAGHGRVRVIKTSDDSGLNSVTVFDSAANGTPKHQLSFKNTLNV